HRDRDHDRADRAGGSAQYLHHAGDDGDGEEGRRLNVSPDMVRRMIAEKILPASQVVSTAPWEIAVAALDYEPVRQRIAVKRTRTACPRRHVANGQLRIFSES